MNSQVNLKKRIATRQSALALWQANESKELLSKLGYEPEVVPTVTTGDKIQKSALALTQLPEAHPARQHVSTGKGLFIKEVQDLLLDETCHLAVHSMKDLPITQTEELCLAGFLPAAQPRDVLILNPKLNELYQKEFPNGTNCKALVNWLDKKATESTLPIGTTSTRRQGLLRHLGLKNSELKMLRGNVDSRLKRVQNSEFSAILLAEAGLKRLGLFSEKEMVILPSNEFIPACAQGVVGLESHTGDSELSEKLYKQSEPSTVNRILFERLCLYLLEGGCHSIVGIHDDENQFFIFSAKNVDACQNGKGTVSAEKWDAEPWKSLKSAIAKHASSPKATAYAEVFKTICNDKSICEPLMSLLEKEGHVQNVKDQASILG